MLCTWAFPLSLTELIPHWYLGLVWVIVGVDPWHSWHSGFSPPLNPDLGCKPTVFSQNWMNRGREVPTDHKAVVFAVCRWLRLSKSPAYWPNPVMFTRTLCPSEIWRDCKLCVRCRKIHKRWSLSSHYENNRSERWPTTALCICGNWNNYNITHKTRGMLNCLFQSWVLSWEACQKGDD